MPQTNPARGCADYGVKFTPLADGGVLIEAPTPLHLDLEGANIFEREFAAATIAARKLFNATHEASKPKS